MAPHIANSTNDHANSTSDRTPGLASADRNWRRLLALGVFWLVLGLSALVLPFAATLAIELLIGIALLVGGIGQFVHASRDREWPSFALQLLGGALAVIAGGLLLLFPIRGIAALTLILSAFFVASGIWQIVTALQNRALPQWRWLLVSGVLGLIIGILILLGWPTSAIWAIGLLVGIEFTVTGAAMIALALAVRRRGP